MIRTSRTFFLTSFAFLILVAAIHGQDRKGMPEGSQGGPVAGGRGGMGFGALPTPPPPKPLVPDAKPVRSCESLAEISLPDTTIESAAVDPGNPGICRVTAYTTHPPMGYNVRGWYGIPMGPPPDFSKIAPKKPNPDGNSQPEAKTAAKPKTSLFYNPNDPPNLRELSKKDVMNVLDIVRKEFNVDERRIYLMGHSMGGAGTLYLGVKYASNLGCPGPHYAGRFWPQSRQPGGNQNHAGDIRPWR